MGILKTLTINGTTYNVTNVVPASNVTLLASAWEGDGDDYSQVVIIPDVTTHTKVDFQLTKEQVVEFRSKDLAFFAENDGGTITVYAVGDKPKGDHTLQITKTEVNGTGKIRGDMVGTTIKPEKVLVKATNLTEEEQAQVRENLGVLPGSGEGASINDGAVSGVTTWSSEKISRELAKLAYEPIEIVKFAANSYAAELGSTASVTLSWELSKEPKSIYLQDDSGNRVNLSGIEGTRIVSGVSKAVEWTLTVTDEEGATATSKVSFGFHNRVYYGAAAAVTSYSSTFIRGLSGRSGLTGSKLTKFTANAGDGQYIYYCLPKRYGVCQFTVNGFTGGFSLMETVSFTNASGYTEDYYVYRSVNAGLGDTTVTVS